MRIDFCTNRTFCEPNQKFDRTSSGLACPESKFFSGIMSLQKREAESRLRILYLHEPNQKGSYRTFGSVRRKFGS
jgi:hypothetical protein